MVQSVLTKWLLEVRQLDAERGAQEMRARDAAMVAASAARQDNQPESVQQSVAGAAFQGSLAAEPALITQADYDALAATPITAQDLIDLAGSRGQYMVGDTRSYVLIQEQTCQQYNCWMVRQPNGTPQLISAPVT